MTTLTNVNEQEQRAIVSLCILAAFADGAQSELERCEIKRIVENFSDEGSDLTGAYQATLAGKRPVPQLVQELQSPNAKALAYEMAVCICNVDQPITSSEQQFLADLRQALGLDAGTAATFQQAAATLSAEPFGEPPIITDVSTRDSELDKMIVNIAILTGALELIPQTLATMAIVPIQMRMVYQIGKSHGYELDLGHTKEFLATVGVGLTSQVLEGYLSRLVRGVTRRFAGRLVAGLVTQAAESALAFATTYALGQTAKSYYASGRTLSTAQLREVFASMLNQGRSIKSQYAGQIAQRSSNLNISDLLPIVKQTIP